jgi:hypothetical protein
MARKKKKKKNLEIRASLVASVNRNPSYILNKLYL